MMRQTLVASILLNSLLMGLLGYLLVRAGGCNHLRLRLAPSEATHYLHRSEQFQQLPLQINPIVLLGDSHIAQAEWQELIQERSPILNRGINDDQVQGVQARLPEILRHQPSIVVLSVGMQDLLLDTPLEQIEKSYFELVKNIQQRSPSTLLVLNNLPPINEESANYTITNQSIRELNIRLEQIARTAGIPYIDLHSKLSDQSGNLASRFSKDGIYLNAAAYKTWKDLLLPILAVRPPPSPPVPQLKDSIQ
jgi:lysophospholipase L1-like esterase